MRDFIKNSKKITLVLLLAMILEILSPFMGMVVEAKNGDQIVDSLEIIGGKKDEYRPGDVINVRGDWSLPNDRPETEYKEGDTFSITIPEGLKPNFGKISLGSMGQGQVNGDRVEFIFNENIEQLMDRKGGFYLSFIVDTPDEEKKALPLDFKDDRGIEILKETININDEKSGVEVTGAEEFAKGAYSFGFDSRYDGLKWFIRVNKDGKLSDSGNTQIILEDNIIGESHTIEESSIKISKQEPNNSAVGSEISEDEKNKIFEISEDGKSFKLKLDITGGYWYDIQYWTVYNGNYEEDILSAENGMIDLSNKATLYLNDGSKLDGSSEKNGVSTGQFNLGGWAEGKAGYGKLSIKKVDSRTKKPLKDAKFGIYNLKTGNKVLDVTTGEDGLAKVANNGEWLNGGKYLIKEITSPEGYRLSDKKYLVDIGNNETKEIVIENEPEPIEIKVKKEWNNFSGDFISPEDDIAVKLLADGKEIRQAVIKKADKEVTFKNLVKFNEKDEEVKYTVEEIGPEGYEVSYSELDNGEIIITNTKIDEPKAAFKIKKVDSEEGGPGLKGAEFEIFKGETSIKRATSNDDGIVTFEGLEKGDYILKEVKAPISYRLDEKEYQLKVKDGKVFIEGKEVDEYQFINKKDTLNIKVNKVWKDRKNNETLPEIKVELLANGDPIKSKILSEVNSWESSFENLSKYDNQDEKIEYNIREIVPEGYKSEVSGSVEEGFIVTNTKEEPLIPLEPAKTSVKVEKKWLDEKGLEVKENLQAIEVKLLADGKDYRTITLNEENNWKHKFEDLPVVNDIKDTKEIEYSVVEVDIPEGYKSEVSGSVEEGFIVTNTKEEPTDPEPTDPEPTDPEPTDPEPTDPEPTDPEPTDPEPTDPEPTDPEPTNPEPTDPEPTDPEPTDPEPTDPEPTDPEPTDPEPTDPEPTDPEPTDPEPTDPEPTDPEPTDPEPTDPEPTDPEPTDPEPTDPEKPVKPTEPTEPEKPTVPEKPVVEEPEKPTVPGKPVIEEPEKPTVPEKPVVEEPEKPTVPEEPVIEDPEEPVIGEGEIADENDDSHIMGDSAENEDNNSYIEDKNENHDSSVKGDSMEGDSENNSNSPILPKTGQTGNLVFIIIGLFMVLVGIKLNEEEA